MLLQRLAKALEKAKIKYALIGGFAVGLQGAVRGTLDIDLAIALTEKTFRDVESLLKDLDFESRLPVQASQVFQFREEYIKNRNLIAWSFYNPKDPTEIIDIVITEDARKIKTDRFMLGKTPVHVASKKDLIRMKKTSARPQDLLDAKALEKILHENEK